MPRDLTLDAVPVEARADIAEAAARLFALIHPAPDVSSPVLDGLQRVCAWSRDYLRTPEVVHRHFILDAGADLAAIEPSDPWESDLISAALRVATLVGVVGSAMSRVPVPCRPSRKPEAPKPGRPAGPR